MSAAISIDHDESGFLKGAPVSLGNEMHLLEAIQRDVRAIRNAVASVSKFTAAKAAPVASPSPATPVPVRPVANANAFSAGARGKALVATPAAPSAPAGGLPAVATVTDNGPKVVSRVSVPPQGVSKVVANAPATTARDSNGRFVSGGGNSSDDEISESKSLGLMSSLRFLGGAIERQLSAEADVADPMVKAYGEIAQPLSGLVGGMRSLGSFGAQSGEGRFYTRWFKKILASMSLGQSKERELSEETNELLEDILDKPSGSRDGSSSVIKSAGLLPRLFAPVMKSGRGLLSLLKKVPLLGALLGGGAFLWDSFNIESDRSMNRREKDSAVGKSAGGILGMFGGILAGAAVGTIAGPIGTVVGGVVGGFLGDSAGQIIGERVGLWVNDLRAANLPEKIASLWQTVTAPLAGVASTIAGWWSENMPSFSAVKDRLTGFASSAIEFLSPATDAAADYAVRAAQDTTLGRIASQFLGIDNVSEHRPPTRLVDVSTVAAPARLAVRTPTAPPSGTPGPTRLSSNSKTQTVRAVVQAADAGQDVGDRQIAQIATGGLN